MKRRLPLVAERALADVKAIQIKMAQDYELQLRLGSDPISCKKGCAACCSHPFLISIAEGVLLYRWLQEKSRWTSALRRKLIETREMTRGVAFEVWLLSDIPCPLLDDAKRCSVYGVRPLRCRVMYSIGDPSLCQPNALGPGTPLAPDVAETMLTFARASLEILKKAGVKSSSLMPLAEALILGEAVETGKLDIKEATLQHLRDRIVNG